MGKRSFDNTRAYKLARVVIILISVAFGFFGGSQLYNVFEGAYSIDKIESYCSGSAAEGHCHSYFIIYGDYSKAEDHCSGAGAKTFCRSLYHLQRREFENSGWKNLGAATVLVVTFFGGTILYRYLFPTRNESET